MTYEKDRHRAVLFRRVQKERFLGLTAASPLRVLKFDAPDGARVVVAASPQFIASLRRLARFARKIV